MKGEQNAIYKGMSVSVSFLLFRVFFRFLHSFLFFDKLWKLNEKKKEHVITKSIRRSITLENRIKGREDVERYSKFE